MKKQLDVHGFKIVGSDKFKEARIVELDNHPFFIATLFVPQDNSSFHSPHPLVAEFILSTINETQKKDELHNLSF